MSFIYITGAPGVGKSTIQKGLELMGFEVYDLDNVRFGGPYNKATGERVTIPLAENRENDWFDRHEWRIHRAAFEELKRESLDKNIIICGVAESDGEIVNLFDKVLYLHVTDDELKKRLHTRVDNDYGKNASELAAILERKKKLDKNYVDSSAITIDASGPVDVVIHDLLVHIKT